MARGYLGVSVDLELATKVKKLAEERDESESSVVAAILKKHFDQEQTVDSTSRQVKRHRQVNSAQ